MRSLYIALSKTRSLAQALIIARYLINVSFAGLFEYSHMEFNAERGAAADAEEGAAAGASIKADDPSLADMTRTALSILLKNDKGFFLLIEGRLLFIFI